MLTYAIVIPVMLILDGIWIYFIMAKLYKDALGSFLRSSANGSDPIYWAWALVYVLMVVGLVELVLVPANSTMRAAVLGGIFGFVVYGVFAFTCYAVIKDWPLHLACADFIWGGVLCSLTSVITYSIVTIIQR
jgi:uncharacterized membrane protein